MVNFQELRKISKTKRRDFIYSFMDYLAYFPAWLFLHTPLTANQVTIIWIIGQIISALLVAKGTWLSMLIGVTMFQLFFILDCSDGIVARYKKQFSLNGVYFDYLGHYIANPLLMICFGIGTFKITGKILPILLGIFAALLFLWNKATTLNPLWYSDKKHRHLIGTSFGNSLLKNQNTLIYSVFALFRLEYIFNLMFFGALLGLHYQVLVIYTLFFLLELMRKIVMQIRNNYLLDKNRGI
ncbi:MAG: hypothetical protein AABX05_03000 [Nanoarchaeota archaeon]